jgi:cytochrome P450
LRFPRDLRELMATPKWLQEVLQRAGALPAGSEVAEVRRRGGLQNEPDKERTAAVLDLVMRGDASRAVTPVFVKFQTGRGMPLWLQAVRAAIEPGVAREVDFYRCLAGVVPLRAPRPYYADAAHAVNRVCLVLEHVDGYNPADWRGCPLPGVRAMLAEVARMNAVYLGRTANDPATAWIPAKVGLDYASFVDTLAGTPPAWYRDLWQALVRYFRHRPITLVHGDCRPGNMLFRDDGRLARGAQSGSEHEAAPWPPSDEPPPEVVFADWEAVNAAPLLWDFTYCTIIGLRVADRRVHLDRLLAEFLSALRAAGAPESLCDPECSRAEVDLLALVLYYIAALVLAKGYWDRQGNTLEDFRAWSGRVLAAVQAVDAERAAAMLGVAPGLVRRLQREAALLPVGVSRAPDRSPAASRLQTADPITVGKILATRGDAGWLALHERYGRVFRYRGGVVTSEPEDFQALLSNRVHTQRRSLSHRLADRFVPGAPGILFKDGDDWLLRLRALMPSMQPQAVAAQEARLRSVVEAHVAAWPADYSGPDLFAEVTTLGLKIALSVGANLDLKDPLVQELGAVLRAYKASTMRSDPRRRLDEFGLSSRKLLHLPWIAVAFHEFAAHMRRLERLVEEIIRRQPWADPARQGWLQLLHAAGLRGSALASELNHLYGAFTAADYTTTCALAELAHAPEWVARLRAECEADPAGPELPVAEAILRETARRYPVAMVIYRELGATMKLGGELFPSGTQVMVLPYALHHDAALWQRPLAFDPGRWHSELPARTAAAYAPFLRGPRRCIGQDFASQQLRIVLHALLRRHELTVDARPVVNPFIIPRLAAPLRFLFRATRNTRGTARQ